MLGELPFTVALAVLGVIGLREFFAMTEAARPIAPAAYIALPAMVFAAHFGDSFQILLIGTVVLPAAVHPRRRRSAGATA